MLPSSFSGKFILPALCCWFSSHLSTVCYRLEPVLKKKKKKRTGDTDQALASWSLKPNMGNPETWTSLHMLWISCNMSRHHESKLLVGWWWGKQAASWEDCKARPQGLAKGFPGGAVVKNLLASAGDARDTGLIPGWGRSPKGGNGNPLQYSCPENAMDRVAWWATVHGVSKSQTWLSNWAWAMSLARIQIKKTESQQTIRT